MRVIAKKALPQGLHEIIDAIRQFGNFSAHPITDITSLQVIDVEPEEAEWCLEIIEGLFDHYYVKPAEEQEQKGRPRQESLAERESLPPSHNRKTKFGCARRFQGDGAPTLGLSSQQPPHHLLDRPALRRRAQPFAQLPAGDDDGYPGALPTQLG